MPVLGVVDEFRRNRECIAKGERHKPLDVGDEWEMLDT